mmetsp:Transcript_8148/g.30176  ORF Transcript_8148/g.30176 Transcript_8148/m.30176 type:complete len:396 (+) Transcript_8148:81-1268(+)
MNVTLWYAYLINVYSTLLHHVLNFSGPTLLKKALCTAVMTHIPFSTIYSRSVARTCVIRHQQYPFISSFHKSHYSREHQKLAPGKSSKNHTTLYSFFESFPLTVPKYNEISISQRRELWNQMVGWTRKQFYDNYTYHQERENTRRKRRDQDVNGITSSANLLKQESNPAMEVDNTFMCKVSLHSLGDSLSEHQRTFANDSSLNAVLLDYLKQEDQLKWEYKTNNLEVNPPPQSPSPLSLRQTLLQKKNAIIKQTGLTRKQLNDRLKLLRHPNRLRVTQKHKALIAQFLKTMYFPSIETSPISITARDRDYLSRETGLTRRQINTQLKLVEDNLNGHNRNISQANRNLVREFMEKIDFVRPNSEQRDQLQASTGLGRKQLNELILRFRRRYRIGKW